MTRATLAWCLTAVLVAAAPEVSFAQGRGQRSRGAGQDPPSRYAIAGRVVDQAKRPVADAFVTALLPSYNADRPFSAVNVRLFTTTDEHGNFRLEGLYPADFYVVVLPHNASVDRSGRPTRDGYANTFYPSALTSA